MIILGWRMIFEDFEITFDYRYGFNGMEKDDEVKGEGNSYTTEFRQYDSRVGRWLSVDPKNQFVGSQYSAFVNNPILHIDPDGGWIPGVDEDGNITLTAEKGDNVSTLISFFGDEGTALKYVHWGYIYSNIQKTELHQGSYPEGGKSQDNSGQITSVYRITLKYN